MRFIIIPDDDEDLVEVTSAYSEGILTFSFSPDFIDAGSLEIYTMNLELREFETKIYLPDS